MSIKSYARYRVHSYCCGFAVDYFNSIQHGMTNMLSAAAGTRNSCPQPQRKLTTYDSVRKRSN